MQIKTSFLTMIILAISAILVACGGESGSTSVADGEMQAQQSYEWKLVTTWPKNFPGLGEAPETLLIWLKKCRMAGCESGFMALVKLFLRLRFLMQ